MGPQGLIRINAKISSQIMEERILAILKSGKLGKLFQSSARDLEKYLKGKKGKKYLSEKHIIESRVQSIYELLTSFKFVSFFLGEDYTNAFEKINYYMNRISFPGDLKDINKLKEIKDFFGHLFKEHLDEDFRDKLKYFSDEEIFRLNEALTTLKHKAYFSSVVMSVSAVESRLHSIIKKEKPRLYHKQNLAESPLGHLFGVVNKDRKFIVIKKSLPQKFFSLINICNNYRIFSAHPKKEIMTYQDALAIFSLSIAFLLELRKDII